QQFIIGQLSASTAHLRKSIALCREIKDEYEEAASRQDLGRVLAFQGKIKGAEEVFKKGFELAEKRNNIQIQGVISAYRSLSALLQARRGKERPAGEALEQARRALEFAEKTVETRIPVPRDFVEAYWLLGEALVQCRLLGTVIGGGFEIPFYDEHFQRQTQSVAVQSGNEPAAAQRCLHEALRRCRKTNMVEMEPDILLSLARLDRAAGLPPNETLLTEAMEISLRAGYRQVLADLHLFCGQILLEMKEPATLLGFNAKAHLQKAKSYALDVSEFSHLYPSANPDFYTGIPEYEMMKRGMTEEERIENGYRVVYQIAEEMGKINC
ncbi:MAG: hypothetical protein GY950_04615, partial [bacterium]|nr:hypothetical protein [bacterium]